MSDSPGRRRRRARPGAVRSHRGGAARTASRLSALAALALLPGALLVVPVHPVAAQQPAQGGGRVAGTVLGTGNQPVGDVQVIVTTASGARLGAITNAQGRYNIGGVPAGTVTVRTQRIGFQSRTQTVAVQAGQVATLDFQLTQAATQLTEVRTVGYTNETGRQISGAVSSVSGNDVQDQKVATVEEALRGRVPGVQVQAGGQPGRPAQITIRGPSSLGNTSPLYVVDGMYVGNQNPNLNPDDIASFEVLKDASAAAQYGSQAANGVIVITTRRGLAGQTQFSANAYYGFQSIPKTIPMASAAEFQRVQVAAYNAAGLTLPADVPAGLRTPTSVSTDWQSAIMRTGGIQNYNVQASGGTTTANYLVSGSFLNQDGTIMNTNFARGSLRVNTEARRGRLRVGENLAASQVRQSVYPNGIFGGQALPLIDVVLLPPTIPVRDSTTPSGWGYGSDATPNYGTNPVGALTANYTHLRSNAVIGSAFADVALFKGLSYRLNLGINYADSGNTVWTSSQQLRYLTPVSTGASLLQAAPRSQQLLYENLLNYDGTFGGTAHHLTAVAGQTSQNNSFEMLTASRNGFPNEGLQQINAGTSTALANSGYTNVIHTNSLLARATYSFRDRYLATGTIRRDCSSLFSPGNRCGQFGSGSVGYVVSDEAFFKAIPLIGGADLLKFRASLGVLGSQAAPPYAYTAFVNGNINAYYGGTLVPGATQTALVNTNLQWQQNRNADVGFDLGLFHNALSITADYYQATLDKLLVGTAIPADLGSGGNPIVNAGRMRNAGFELGATHRLERGALQFNTTFTLTTLANRVLSLGNGGQPLFSGFGQVERTTVGQPIGEFYLWQNCGLFSSADAVKAHTSTVGGKQVVIQPGAQPGDVCYQDTNNDGTINDADRVNAGTPLPKLTSGLFFESRYRSFDVGLNLRGSFGNKIYNVVEYNVENTSGVQNIRAGLNYWTPSNTNTDIPRAVHGTAGAANFNAFNNHFLENGDYVRIQNLVIGYTLPGDVAQRLRLNATSRPRLYFNVQNLATFTKYKGFDPEVVGFGDPLARGVDDGLIYPNPRTVTFGFDVRF